MKYTLIILLSFLFFTACSNDSVKQKAKKQTAPAAVIEQSDVFLYCQSVKSSNEESDAPAYEVFLQLSESKLKVADILNCETIPPDLYERHQIPKNAISAAGGWWAGGGDYLYLIEENSEYVLKKGQIYEESEDGNYNYQTISKFSKSGKQIYD